MIPFKFSYYRPDTYQEAVKLFHQLKDEKKNPLYYSGGTEIVTNARKGVIKTEAIIDIKNIPEGNVLKEIGDILIMGANLNLNEIVESSNFLLLNNVVKRIADHTVRNRLTLGGNICGRLAYREAILPLLATETSVVVANEEGLRKEPLRDIFDKRLRLKPGEILLQIEIPQKYTQYHFYSERREKQGKVDYPLIHVVALQEEEKINFAFSGICAFPFRSYEIEEVLNNKNLDIVERGKRIVNDLPASPKEDVFASGEFRKFLTEKAIINALNKLEGGV